MFPDQRRLQELAEEAEGQLEDHHQRHRRTQGRWADDHFLGLPHAGGWDINMSPIMQNAKIYRLQNFAKMHIAK